MCFPIHGTISDGINIADYPTSYNEYNEVKLFLKVSLFSSLLSAYGLAKLLRSDICSVLLFPSIFFRILKFLCYFGTYGMYTYDKFFWQIFLAIFFWQIFWRILWWIFWLIFFTMFCWQIFDKFILKIFIDHGKL